MYATSVDLLFFFPLPSPLPWPTRAPLEFFCFLYAARTSSIPGATRSIADSYAHVKTHLGSMYLFVQGVSPDSWIRFYVET